jgi:hypothetical protein
MAQVIKHAHEEHEIEFLSQLGDVINRELAKLDIDFERFRNKTRLPQITFIEINAENAVCATPFHLDAVKPGVAADIEHAFAGKIIGYGVRKLPPFDCGIVAKEVMRRGPEAVQVDVLKPRGEIIDLPLQVAPF